MRKLMNIDVIDRLIFEISNKFAVELIYELNENIRSFV